jgi:hypothetical protein
LSDDARLQWFLHRVAMTLHRGLQISRIGMQATVTAFVTVGWPLAFN